MKTLSMELCKEMKGRYCTNFQKRVNDDKISKETKKKK